MGGSRKGGHVNRRVLDIEVEGQRRKFSLGGFGNGVWSNIAWRMV